MFIEVSIQKTLRAGAHTFTLDIQLKSTARRIAIVGPSGGGKSLTLKAIAGLLTPDAGLIRVDGSDWFDARRNLNLPPRQRRAGYLFQDYALFPHLNVRQNVAFGLSDRRGGWFNPSSRIRSESLDYWLKAFELDALDTLHPHQLSGGQRQRVALARTLAVEPRLLLLDEPFAAVDAMLRNRMRGELNDLQNRLDLPTILITHDPVDAEALADEIFYLRGGTIAGSGTDWGALETVNDWC